MSAAATSTASVDQVGLAEARRIAIMVTFALCIAVGILAVAQGGPSYFIGLGERSTALEFARDILGEEVSVPLADGHDGESFWLLARDPSLSAGEDLAQYLDRPLYRAQRIGYPLLASPWGVLGEHALLWGLVVTNLVAIGVGTYLVARAAVATGRSPRTGYLFALNPAAWLALLFDFSDAVALAGLVGFVLAIQRRHWGWAAVAATLAGLAKESSALGIAAVTVGARGLSLRERAQVSVPPAVAVLSWRAYVMTRPGFESDPEIQEFALIPFSGFEEAWRRGWLPNDQWFYAVIAVLLVPSAAMVVWRWWHDRRAPALLAALPYALFVPFLSGQVLNIAINSLRAFGPAITLAGIGWMPRGAHAARREAASSPQ